MKKAIIFGMLLLLTACAYVDPSITDQTRIYYDSPVRKSALQVTLHPRAKQYRPLTAYFPPFVVQQETPDYDHLGLTFGSIFQHAWLEERLFPIMEPGRNPRYSGLQASLRQARDRGADLLILGMVPYFYAGHTVDDTAITIQINIYSASNGMLLWSMAQSGRIEEKQPDDYIYFRHEYRLPTAPFNKIIRSIAKDMAVPLKSWLPSPDTPHPFAETRTQMVQALSTPPSATPQVAQPANQMAEGVGIPAQPAPDSPLPAQGEEIAAEAEQTIRPETPAVNLDIRFDFDKSVIRPESHSLLDSLGQALTSPELKGRKIIIAGHTDSVGDAKYNMRLSQSRARAVKQYLVDKFKIAPSLIETAGYGDSRPIATEGTTEGRQKNRRVEIRLAE